MVFDGADHTTIGGADPQDRNVVSGNENLGIGVLGTNALVVTDTVIQGNYVGTDVTGTVAIGNHQPGIGIIGGAANTTVGGTAANAGNLVSGNAGGGCTSATSPGPRRSPGPTPSRGTGSAPTPPGRPPCRIRSSRPG